MYLAHHSVEHTSNMNWLGLLAAIASLIVIAGILYVVIRRRGQDNEG